MSIFLRSNSFIQLRVKSVSVASVYSGRLLYPLPSTRNTVPWSILPNTGRDGRT